MSIPLLQIRGKESNTETLDTIHEIIHRHSASFLLNAQTAAHAVIPEEEQSQITMILAYRLLYCGLLALEHYTDGLPEDVRADHLMETARQLTKEVGETEMLGNDISSRIAIALEMQHV